MGFSLQTTGRKSRGWENSWIINFVYQQRTAWGYACNCLMVKRRGREDIWTRVGGKNQTMSMKERKKWWQRDQSLLKLWSSKCFLPVCSRGSFNLERLLDSCPVCRKYLIQSTKSSASTSFLHCLSFCGQRWKICRLYVSFINLFSKFYSTEMLRRWV